MERKPIPEIFVQDFQYQAQAGLGQQPHPLEQQQQDNSSQPPQHDYQSPPQLPEPVHQNNSLRSSNRSPTPTISSANNSLSYLRHDPGAGPPSNLHHTNTMLFPFLFLLPALVLFVLVIVYTFGLERELPHRWTAVFCIAIATVAIPWGLCIVAECYRKKIRKRKSWSRYVRDVEKASGRNEQPESVREPAQSKPQQILKYLSRYSSLFSKPPFKPTASTLTQDPNTQTKTRQDAYLTAAQIRQFGAGRNYQSAGDEQRKLRESFKRRERESRRQNRRREERERERPFCSELGDTATGYVSRRERERERAGRSELSGDATNGYVGQEERQRQNPFSHELNDTHTNSYMNPNGARMQERGATERAGTSNIFIDRKGKGRGRAENQRPPHSLQNVRYPVYFPATTHTHQVPRRWDASKRAYFPLTPQPRSPSPSPPPLSTSSSTSSSQAASSSGINSLETRYRYCLDEENGFVDYSNWEREREERKPPASSFDGMGLGDPAPVPDDDDLSGKGKWWKMSSKPVVLPLKISRPSLSVLERNTQPEVQAQNQTKPRIQTLRKGTTPAFSNIASEAKPKAKSKSASPEAKKPMPVSRIHFNRLEAEAELEFSEQEVRRECAFNALVRMKGDGEIQTQGQIPEVQTTTVNSPPSQVNVTDELPVMEAKAPTQKNHEEQGEEKEEEGKDNDNSPTISPTTLLHRSQACAILNKPRSPEFRAKVYEEMSAPIPAFCRSN